MSKRFTVRHMKQPRPPTAVPCRGCSGSSSRGALLRRPPWNSTDPSPLFPLPRSSRSAASGFYRRLSPAGARAYRRGARPRVCVHVHVREQPVITRPNTQTPSLDVLYTTNTREAPGHLPTLSHPPSSAAFSRGERGHGRGSTVWGFPR